MNFKKGVYIMTKTENALRNRIAANNFDTIKLEMKCNGDVVRITPCSYVPTITSFEQVEWYLIDSPSINLAGSKNLSEVADTLDNYANLLNETDDEIDELKQYIINSVKEGKEIDWGWVSDWHKDLFGHRPHVGEDAMIRWAASPSKTSARFA